MVYINICTNIIHFMFQNFLEQIWLNPQEAKIYSYLLENKRQSIASISKQTGIHRPKLYSVIPAMLERGIITQVLIGKRKMYQAENPEVLQGYFTSLQNDFDTLLPMMQESYTHASSKPIFTYYSGAQGIKQIFLDIARSLKKDDVFYRYSSRNNVEKTSIPEKDYSEYRTMRDKKQLQRMVISSTYLQSYKEENLDKDVVVIPENMDLFQDNITKIIYGNKVAIIDYNTRVSFVIESRVFAWFEKKTFLMLFKFLKKIPLN